MSKHTRFFLFLSAILFVVLIVTILITQSGCAATKPVPNPSINGAPDAAVKAQLHVQTALAEANALRQYVLPPGLPHVDSIVSHLTGADFQLDKNRAVLAWYSDEWGKQHDIIEASNIALVRYHNQWIGDRTVRWVWAILAIWASIGVASALVAGFFPTGIIGSIAGGVLRFLPVANLFVRGRDIIRAKQGGGLVTISRNVFGNKV